MNIRLAIGSSGGRATATLLFLVLLFGLLRIAGAASAPREDMLDVHFIDEKSGWASGRWGTVVGTNDGGHTWRRQSTGVDYTLAGIHFVDDKNGWAVGDKGTIIHTADGGKTWVKQHSPVPLFLMRVRFRNPQVGWIVAERTHILYTNDGGATWTVQFSDGDFILKSLAFADDKNGWAVGEYGHIYHTTDAGKSWVKQAGRYGMSEQTGEILGDNFLFDICAVDAKNAWVVGIDGYVARTEDGGASWHEIKTGAAKTQVFSVAASGGSVVIAGNGLLLTSGDNGASWKRAKTTPSADYGWFYRLASHRNGYVAVGWQGAIYVSDTKAENWQRAVYE